MAVIPTMTAPGRGQANYGELGYGANGKKSSANPGKVDSLEGVKTQQVLPLAPPHHCRMLGHSLQETVPCDPR